MYSLPDLTITLPSGMLGNSRSTTNVPIIVGATFGSIGLLILIAVLVFFLRRHKRPKSTHIDGPLEELRPRQQEVTNITPSPDEIRFLMTDGCVQEDNRRYFVQNQDTPSRIPQTLHTEKILTTLSPDLSHHTGRVAGGSRPAVT